MAEETTAQDLALGESEFKSILRVWQLEVAAGPLRKPTLEEICSDPIDERDRQEAQEYIDSWDHAEHDDRWRRIKARVAYAETLLLLHAVFDDATADEPDSLGPDSPLGDRQPTYHGRSSGHIDSCIQLRCRRRPMSQEIPGRQEVGCRVHFRPEPMAELVHADR